MEGPIAIVVIWQPHPEFIGDVESIVLRLRERSLREPGCISYDVLRTSTEPLRFVLFEKYEDVAAFEAHKETPWFRELVDDRLDEMLVARENSGLLYAMS